MATYSHRSHQYSEQPQFLQQHAFGFSPYDEREKTPTDSLLNHTGLSPLPLTTTPPLSRLPSHAPEPLSNQAPEQLLYEYEDGSLSDSPTSVRTPDNDSFEVEMLDAEPPMHHFYHQGALGMSTQVTHNTIPAADSTALFTSNGSLSNDIIDETFIQVQHAYRYQQPHASDFQPTPALGHDLNGNYMIQPHQHRREPWNGQWPPRSPLEPRSGTVIFDPVTDPGSFNHMNVQDWMALTDPRFMISPSTETAPHGTVFNPTYEQNLPYRHSVNIAQGHARPLPEVALQIPQSSPPPDNYGFINYTPESDLFTEAPGQYSPSSPGNSSNGNYPQSPYQPNISPAAASPSSDGQFSFMYDREMIDPYPANPQFLQIPQMPNATLNINLTPARAPEIQSSRFPEPESSHQGATVKITGKSSGGRALGTHLEPTVAKAAHDMRKITACWHCVLQRDRCGPGDICDRCHKRSQRPNADCGLGCSRIKLVDLSEYFLPALVTQMHEDSHLKHFVSQHIHQWGNVEITIYMTCGQFTMPRIPVKVYEFVPKGEELLRQIQYVTDPQTNRRMAVSKQSPPLGMVHINHNEEKTYDRYISDIVDHHLDALGELCWREDDNDFLQKLFKLMTRVKPKSDDEAKLLREVYRLIVVTFIMSHTLTIAEQGKFEALSRMHSYAGPGNYYPSYTSPRMANRQLKYFFSRLQKSIQQAVLNKLQQIFKSSKGCDKWLAAFVAVLGLCMALEDQQKTIHLVMATRANSEGTDARDAQAQADIACQEIDTRAHFVQQIFRWKYNRKHNPLVNTDHDWEKEVGFGDAASVGFVRQVAQLVRENTDFLQQQQRVSISYANQTKYSSRLVGQFLLSFWLPNA